MGESPGFMVDTSVDNVERESVKQFSIISLNSIKQFSIISLNSINQGQTG